MRGVSIADSRANRRGLVAIAQAVNARNGAFGEFDVDDDPAGDADWLRPDGRGDPEPVDEADLEKEAWDERADIIAAALALPAEAGCARLVAGLETAQPEAKNRRKGASSW